MNETTPQAGRAGAARRRLLRGTFAAPAVMTLVSGSAIAATSVSCVFKQQSNAIDAPTADPDSTWVRVRLWRSSDGNGGFANFVWGNDVLSLLPPGGSYLSAGQWQCVLSGLNFTYPNIYTDPSPAPELLAGKYVAVRIDGTGRIVGVQGIETASSALHTSCWTSFGGAAPF